MTKVAFCPVDKNNLKYFEQMERSLRKFHTAEELPLIRYDNPNPNNPNFWYMATPLIAKELLEKYDVVIKIDADSIITGKLDELWSEGFDVAVVNNANPAEFKKYPVTVWDIHPLAYVNCGLVVMRSKEFVDHWLSLCLGDHFPNYQMREQDLLNILVFYGNYKIGFLDVGDSFYGLASKGYWAQIELKDGKLFLPKGEEWPTQDKWIKVIHFAGGSNDPDKYNYRIRFQSDVVSYLDKLVK